jgi:hypothetical protein
VPVRGLRASVSGLYCVHLRTQRLRTVPVRVCCVVFACECEI